MCVDHGLNFIGPTSKQIQTMGDKATARETMRVTQTTEEQQN